jgi:hypothetical protein
VVWAGVCWFHPSPSLDGAREAFNVGDHEQAMAELDALDPDERGTPAAMDLRSRVEVHVDLAEATRAEAEASDADDTRLSQVSRTTLKIGATLVLRRSWADPNKQRTAHRRLLERAQATADEAWKRGDASALGLIAEDTRGLDEGFTRECEARGLLAAARSCLDEGRMDCAKQALAMLDLSTELEASLEAERLEIERELLD